MGLRTNVTVILMVVTFIIVIVSISLNLTLKHDATTQNNVLISQTTLFGFIIIAILGLSLVSSGTTPASVALPEAIPSRLSYLGKLTSSFNFSFLNYGVSQMSMFILLLIGVITAIVTSSVQLDSFDITTRKNVFIAQLVIFSIVIIGLGYTSRFVIGDNVQESDAYMMAVIHMSLILSVLSLSASTMNKLGNAAKMNKLANTAT